MGSQKIFLGALGASRVVPFSVFPFSLSVVLGPELQTVPSVEGCKAKSCRLFGILEGINNRDSCCKLGHLAAQRSHRLYSA